MDWLALDLLADQLREALERRAFRDVHLRLWGARQLMDAETAARITLADIDHVRAWERIHPEEASDLRRHELTVDVRLLLLHIPWHADTDTG